jgi:hypothetical protein
MDMKILSLIDMQKFRIYARFSIAENHEITEHSFVQGSHVVLYEDCRC